MSMSLECGAIVPGCKFIIHGDDEEDVVMKAIEHMHEAHDIEHVSDHLKARIRAAMQEH